MSSMRLNRIDTKVSGLCLLLTLVLGQAAWAQGFGPDPFRPYNAQYDAYTYPIGPSGAEAGAAAAMMRSGVRGANQFQNYLAEMQGLGRSTSEKYGQGLPYYRSVFDSRFDPKASREYRPNREIDTSFEKVQQRLTAKYLAYFNERDPQKKAQFLKDYQRARRQTSRMLTARRVSPLQFEGAANRAASGDINRAPVSRRDAQAKSGALRSATPATSSEPSTRKSPRAGGAPPPVRSSRSELSSPATGSPSDVLDRARRMERLRGTGRSLRGSVTGRTEDAGLPPDRLNPND